MDGSLDTASLQFLTGPNFKGGGLIAVLGATATIIGGVAGAIGLGLIANGMLNPPR